MAKYKCVIFDLDGTLTNTLEDLKTSVNFALEKHGFPERSFKEIRSFVGNGVRKLVERALPEGTEPGIGDKVFFDFKEHYGVHCLDKTAPYDGVVDVLASLKKEGVKTAIVSNKSHHEVEEIAARFFGGLIDKAVGVSDKVECKPSPDSVNLVLSTLSMKKEDCVLVGDSLVDMDTAKYSGLPFIAVTWGFVDRRVLMEKGATVLADDAAELAEILEV